MGVGAAMNKAVGELHHQDSVTFDWEANPKGWLVAVSESLPQLTAFERDEAGLREAISFTVERYFARLEEEVTAIVEPVRGGEHQFLVSIVRNARPR